MLPVTHRRFWHAAPQPPPTRGESVWTPDTYGAVPAICARAALPRPSAPRSRGVWGRCAKPDSEPPTHEPPHPRSPSWLGPVPAICAGAAPPPPSAPQSQGVWGRCAEPCAVPSAACCPEPCDPPRPAAATRHRRPACTGCRWGAYRCMGFCIRFRQHGRGAIRRRAACRRGVFSTPVAWRRP